MGKHAQIIVGPAGTGKTTYCKIIQDHCSTIKRTVHIVNLDPAVSESETIYSFNIKNLISVDEVMEELKYGPNGGLVFCMEYLMKNFDWFREQVAEFEDDYLLFDCPGQIELYTHYKTFKSLIRELENMGYRVCVVYLLDACFLTSISKFLSGNLACLSTVVNFDTVPHVNVLTKCDLVKEEVVEKFLSQDIDDMLDLIDKEFKNDKFKKLNKAICDILKNFSLVSFLPLNIKKKDSINLILGQIDLVLQFDEDREPRIKDFD